MRQLKKEPPFILHFLIALLLSFFVTTVGILILAMLLYKLHISTAVIDIGVIIIYILSNFIGGFFCGRKLTKRKYLGGLLMGLLYFVVAILLSLIVEQSLSGLGLGLFSGLFLCAASGMLGGCISSSTGK